MPVRSDFYTHALIEAIDDWQAGSKDKERKAARLIKASEHLPANYRTAPAEVFRQLRANAPLAAGVAFDAMADFVSSWTTSLEVAKHFRESDGDRTKALMIFRRRPMPGDVILDLNVVYADPDFMDTVRDAETRGHHVACEVHDSMGVSNGTTALGIAVALGEVSMPRAEQICRDLDLYSSVASCSSGVELTQAQIVLLGNKPGAGGRYRIGHAVMRDALDIDGIYDAIRNAGLTLPDRPRSTDLQGKLVNCFLKCEADRRGTLRGRRQIMLDDSDVHHHRHSKGAVGGVAAAAIGDPAVFVSVDAMHQGPQGGGPVIAIIDAGE